MFTWNSINAEHDVSFFLTYILPLDCVCFDKGGTRQKLCLKVELLQMWTAQDIQVCWQPLLRQSDVIFPLYTCMNEYEACND